MSQFKAAPMSEILAMWGYCGRFIMVRFYPVLECREAEIAVIGVSKRSQ
jgi:hypothetical protein